MIKQVTMYKTVDGMLHEHYVDAKEHNLVLNRKAFLDHLKKLEKEQHSAKKWLTDGLRHRNPDKRSAAQRKLDERRREIRRLRIDLGFKDFLK